MRNSLLTITALLIFNNTIVSNELFYKKTTINKSVVQKDKPIVPEVYNNAHIIHTKSVKPAVKTKRNAKAEAEAVVAITLALQKLKPTLNEMICESLDKKQILVIWVNKEIQENKFLNIKVDKYENLEDGIIVLIPQDSSFLRFDLNLTDFNQFRDSHSR